MASVFFTPNYFLSNFFLNGVKYMSSFADINPLMFLTLFVAFPLILCSRKNKTRLVTRRMKKANKEKTNTPTPKPFEIDSSERENVTNAENVQIVEEQQDAEDQRPCAKITHVMMIILGKIAAYAPESTYLEKLKPRKDTERDFDALLDNVKLALGEDFLTDLRSKYNALLDEGKLVRALPMGALSGNDFSDGVKTLCISVLRAISDLAANEYRSSELKITELLHKANNETVIATLIGKAALIVGENLQKYSKDVEIKSLEMLME